jgi:hypothetical protein
MSNEIIKISAESEKPETNGQIAVRLLKIDLYNALQNIIQRVKPFGAGAAAMGKDVIAYDSELTCDLVSGLDSQTAIERGIRIYWNCGLPDPRIIVSFMQIGSMGNTFFMGQATEGSMAWWYPQAANIDGTFAIIEQAFNSGALNLEQLQLFVSEVQGLTLS